MKHINLEHIYLNEDIASEMGTDSNGKKWEDYDVIVCPDGQEIDMVKLLQDIYRAEASLVGVCPFFKAFMGKLKKVYTFKVQTQATDGVHLFINPQFTYKLDNTQKAFVFAHEIMHNLLNHIRRGKGDDPYKSNIAADYECNITLVDMGLFKITTMKAIGAYVDPKYSGWGYEKIYDSNPPSSSNGSQDNSNQSNQAKKNQQSGQGQSGQGQSGGGQSDNNQQQYSDDYKKGWEQAMQDYKNGKLKIK